MAKNLAKVAIIILNWNGKDNTLECLESVYKIDYPLFEVILVDNDSSDETVSEVKKKYPNTKIVINSSNLGYAEGNNVGAKYALGRGCEYFLLLNNDAIVKEDIISEFLKAFQSLPDAGILGAKICRYYEKNALDHLGGKWSSENARFHLIGDHLLPKEVPYKQKLDYVCGCAIFIKKEVVEKIGLFDKRFFLFWEEADLCYRCRKAGFEIYSIGSAIVWHKISASFKSKPHTQYYWWRNRFLWMEKNIHPRERKKIYWKKIYPEVFHLFKNLQLKKLQYLLGSLFSSNEKQKKREEKIISYKACLQGVRDYFFKRFGPGPSWLIKNRSSQTPNRVIRKMTGDHNIHR